MPYEESLLEGVLDEALGGSYRHRGPARLSDGVGHGLECVPYIAVRHLLKEEGAELTHEAALEVPLVAEHTLAAGLGGLVLLHVRPPEDSLALGMPAQVDVVQLPRVRQEDDLGGELGLRRGGERRARATA